jgi:diguanylate cyclase (GGDEF)-like protein
MAQAAATLSTDRPGGETRPARVLDDLRHGAPTAADDRSFRRAILAIRLLLLALWVGLSLTGILDVSHRDLLSSTAILVAYNTFHVALEVLLSHGVREPEWLTRIVRHLDVVTITVAMVCLHDVRSPVFTIYFLGIVGVAKFVGRDETLAHVAWAIVNYVAFAAITAGRGYDVSWAYVTVVVIGLALMGFNTSVLSGGEQRLREVLAAVAVTDSLTGLPNRRLFHESYSMNLGEAIAQRIPLALMLLDVDHFKEINDRDGHPAGDDKLRDVAAALKSALRGGDLVARYGGDEFVVIAPNTTRDDALKLAERLRAAAAACEATLSIGVAVYPEDAHAQDTLIEAADGALYRAKQAGRNCVRVAAVAAA